MNVGGIELEVGDSIKYDRYLIGKAKPNHCEGVIAHISKKLITVDLGQYRDSFSIQDLACGVIKIPGMSEIIVTTSEIYEPVRPPLRREEKEVRKSPPETKNADPTQVAYPVMKHGRIDWDIMWPIVKTELDKGRNRNEVADEFEIGRDAMRNKIAKMSKAAKPKPVKLAAPTKPVLVALSEIKTIADLKAYRDHLAKERELVDLILRFIDIALREKKEG